MRTLDRYLRDVRLAKARRFVRPGDVVVDVGCADGIMFRRWADLISRGYGVDPTLDGVVEHQDYQLFPGHFPEDLPDVRCDVVTMLAVLEHIPPESQAKLAGACGDILLPGGRIVITVPSPRVDDMLRLLGALRLVDGMSLEEHYGFDPDATPGLFVGRGFRFLHSSKFQLGLNNLYAFEKASA